MNRYKKRLLIILIVLSIIVTACGGSILPEEPSPIPPPPNLDEPIDGGEDTAVSTPIAQITEQSDAGGEQPTAPSDDATEAGAATPLAEVTATSAAEATPTLAPLPKIETNPPTQMGNSGTIPATTRDLVFIGDGALKLLTHQNRQLVELYPGGDPPSDEMRSDDPFRPYFGDITHFDISADGNRIVAARVTASKTLTRSIEGSSEVLSLPYIEHEVLFLDVVSKETWVLAETVTDLQTVTVAPNQQTVAFIGSGLASNPNPQYSDELPDLNVYTVLTPDRSNLREIASCTRFCHTIVWHPTSELFFFADGEALWLYNLSASSPQALLENESADGANIRIYSPISVASNGRYLLMWEGRLEGGSRVVYDIPTQQLIPVPDSFIYADPFPTEVVWMPDTRLLVTRNDVNGSSLSATHELWRINADDGTINLEETSSPGQNGAAASTVNLENGRFAYALINQTDPNASGLYLQTSFSEPNTRVNGVVPGFISPLVTWSPDGSSAVFIQNDTPYFAEVNGRLLNMSPVFGSVVKAFRWLPPATASR